MSGNLNNGSELFPFHLVGKFSRTEAKYLAILTAILKTWLLSLTSLRRHRFSMQHVVFILSLELHKYSNNLPIAVSAAPTEDTARGVSFHGFPVNNHPFAKDWRIKRTSTHSKLKCGCVCSEVISWRIASKSVIGLYYSAVAVVLKKMTEFQRSSRTRKRFPNCS